MQHSKSHHWVPQFYLKRWTNESGRLVSFSRETGRNLVRKPNPKNVACEDLLYTVFVSDGNHIYGEDSIFKSVDQDGAVAIEAALSDDWKKMPNELAEKLYQFIYLLSVRHPTVRDNFLKTENDIFRRIRDDLEAFGLDAYAFKFFRDLEEILATTRDRATLLTIFLAAFGRFTSKALFHGGSRISSTRGIKLLFSLVIIHLPLLPILEWRVPYIASRSRLIGDFFGARMEESLV